MLKKNNTRSIKFLTTLILVVMFFNICSNVFAASSTYQLPLSKLTKFNEVIKYDKDAWRETISKNDKPDDWFDGDADKSGAKSKVTFTRIYEKKKGASSLFFSLFDSFIPENVSLLLFSDPEIVDLISEDIDEQYGKYEVWVIHRVVWDYTIEEFEEDADHTNRRQYILKNPEDYHDILKDYNDWVENLNETLNKFNMTISKVGKKDFLWDLIINDLIIASPFESYLYRLIDELNINNAKIRDNTLILERNERELFTIEAKYGDQGFQSSFIVRNKNGKTIYEIKNSDSRLLVYTISSVTIAVIVSITIIAIIRRKRIHSVKMSKEVAYKPLKYLIILAVIVTLATIIIFIPFKPLK